ncbi:MAG: von Willebrand factor type A domain-containing protein [Vampirovibrionia bacterium]
MTKFSITFIEIFTVIAIMIILMAVCVPRFSSLTNQAECGIAQYPAYNPYYEIINTEKYPAFSNNSIKQTSKEPVSTFSLDVDTASYSNMRRFISNGITPPLESIRVEEFINYFNYDYKGPSDKSKPFKATVNIVPNPWNKDKKLMHIGIKGIEIETENKPEANLTFLIDVSGSMTDDNKLPLLIKSLQLLVNNLKDEDLISIVTYAGSSEIILKPTKVKNKTKILQALQRLQAGGSTAGADGIKTAYQLAEENFNKEKINRVILATDGDFNVGISDPETLKEYIKIKKETGIYLNVLGFGGNNYNDLLMQNLAQNGNGIAAYIDNLDEANKIFVENLYKNIIPIANDVKVQVEFNPDKISEYRLLGYETRILNEEDFKNDKIDAGDIGSGHSITAIYEITDPESKARLIDNKRYETNNKPKTNISDEYAFIKIRYKLPEDKNSKLIEYPITANNEINNLNESNKDIIFSIAVAGFGQLLTKSPYLRDFTYDDVVNLASSAKGEDKYNYRGEFIKLVRRAKTLEKTI